MRALLICLLCGALSPLACAAGADPNLKEDKTGTEGRVVECQSCEYKKTPPVLLHDRTSAPEADKQQKPEPEQKKGTHVGLEHWTVINQAKLNMRGVC